jgi:hypothetical protein
MARGAYGESFKPAYTFAGAGKQFRTLSAAKRAAKTYARKHGEAVRIMKADPLRGHTYTNHWVQPNPSKRKKKKSASKRMSSALKKWLGTQKNPGKGRKVKGGRAVTVRNFSGTIVRKTNGQVVIHGRGKRG